MEIGQEIKERFLKLFHIVQLHQTTKEITVKVDTTKM